jgi:hypothetical protein
MVATEPRTRIKEVATIKNSINLHNMRKSSTILIVYYKIEQPSLNVLYTNWT